ncbi:Putative diacylglycerol kinase, catalytic domain, inorganic polyphosphate/ATP-NAD kinase [Septoria linicola]|uniref:Diacylglycerol kinase, catalytic domain, inorganic polyphosphate/ATP-NAD kinase n=1 Tax=Septoria linicola TaxID=215465 RepID=A0A9Q9AV60_9PEZI|nr:putative diacylglycerol kinase, catalytic domain, inorganic polyphosphate/ATP-NAD kinase [Septoria linicola]USW55434.1 Putative diacylglycerol kinase, catalytic domain, inorganic polyphosphate/ATP-NAD kinase [Septoria linicola]
MGASQSSPAHTEGKIDGRPATLFYKPAEGDDEAGLGYVEGYKVYPTSTWTKISSKNILACVPRDATSGDYYFLYVEENPDAAQNPKASPVLFRSAILNNPPEPLTRDFVAPAVGANCWYFRQDRSTVQPNFHIIVSIASGTGLAADVWKQLVKPALDFVKVDEPKDYVLHYTSSENSISDFTRDVLLPQANLGISQSVMLLSGDGGVVDIVNTILSGQRGQQYTKPNISLLPLGTGNALAHSAGLTQDNSLGLKAWLRGGLKELPLFCASFSSGARLLFDEARQERPLHTADGVAVAHGSVVASWGLHAGLVADSDTTEFRKFGVERFKMAAKEALAPSDGSAPHVYRANVSIQRPGQSEWHAIRDGEHAYVLATLCSQLEKGFTISPAARELDGKLRLVHFGPMSGDDAMSIMGKAYQGGQHVEDERVGYEEIDALRIEFREDEGRWRRVCIDGKIIRVEKDGWVEVRAGQMGVVDLIV